MALSTVLLQLVHYNVNTIMMALSVSIIVVYTFMIVFSFGVLTDIFSQDLLFSM